MPNKAVSKAQFRFFQGIKHGSIHAKGLSAKTASEMLGHQHAAGLPERKKRGLKHIHPKGGK